MPGGFPIDNEICNGTSVGASPSTSLGTAIAPSGSVNTKGSYQEIISATTIDCCYLVLTTVPVGLGAYSMDLAIGGSGSEIVLIADIVFQNSFSLTIPQTFSFPVQIPAGTRISARAQSATAADDVLSVSIQIFSGSFTQMEGAAGVDAIGFTSASTQGTSIDPGGTANTKGSYTQLTASTARDYLGFFLIFDNLNTQASLSSNAQLLDIAVGAAASEVVIVPNFQLRRNNSGIAVLPSSSPLFSVPIPSGTRISARTQSSTNSTPSRLLGLTFYGIYQ